MDNKKSKKQIVSEKSSSFISRIIIVTVIGVAVGVSIFLWQKEYKSPEKIVVAGKFAKISQSDVEKYLLNVKGANQNNLKYADLTAEDLKQVSEQIYLEKRLYNLAKESGVMKKPEVSEAIKQAKKAIVKEAYLRSYISNNLTEEKLRELYQVVVNSQAGKKEYKISHIFLSDEAKAKRIRRYLNKNNFAKVAMAESEDEVSKKNGGDLGYVNESLLSSDVKSAVLSLADGEISAPIKTEQGVQIIMLEARRDVEVPSFAEIEDKLRKNEANKLLRSYYLELLSDADLKVVKE